MGRPYEVADCHVSPMDQVGGTVTDHGIELDRKDVPRGSKQLWAPEAAARKGKCFLFFPPATS